MRYLPHRPGLRQDSPRVAIEGQSRDAGSETRRDSMDAIREGQILSSRHVQ
jgi:hypothetical protein